MSRVFINYRRQDSEGYVGRLYDHLTQHFQRDDLFMDVDNIRPGADFVQVLEEAVMQCDILLAVIGPQWLTVTDEGGARRIDSWNDFVRIEIATALKHNKLVVPLLVGHARMPSPGDLPEDLAALSRRNAFELTHARFTEDVKRLAEVILSSLPARGGRKPQANTAEIRRKETALKAMRMELFNAKDSPLYAYRTQNNYFPLLGDGNPDADIVMIGEGPGKYEAVQGRVFVGPSGEVLDELLLGIGLARNDIFITNLIHDHSSSKSPTMEQIAFYSPYVDRMLNIIQPGVIVTLGRFATHYLLKRLNLSEQDKGISHLNGKLLRAQASYGDINVLPLYHPAAVLYTASLKETLRQGFEKLRVFV